MKNLFILLLLLFSLSGFAQKREKKQTKESLVSSKLICKLNDSIKNNKEEIIRVWLGSHSVFHFKIVNQKIIEKKYIRYVDILHSCDTFSLPKKNKLELDIGIDTAMKIVKEFKKIKLKNLRNQNEIKKWNIRSDAQEYFYEQYSLKENTIKNYSSLEYEKNWLSKKANFRIKENKKAVKINKILENYFNLDKIDEMFFITLENGCYGSDWWNYFKVINGKIIPIEN